MQVAKVHDLMHFGHAWHATHHVSTTKLEGIDCEEEENPEACHIFQHFDANGDNHVSVDEAVDAIMAEMAMHMEPHLNDEVSNFIAEHDTDNDGELDYHELLDALHYAEEHEPDHNE